MTAPAAALELRRAVWRHERGRLASGRAAFEGLDEEYRRALDEQQAMEGEKAVIRAHAPALLRGHDDALRAARRALEDEVAGAALGHLLRARERMEVMRELLAADAALARAAEAVRRLWAAARVPALRALPCVDAPGRLLAAARAHMAEGCWARAAYLAGACLHQAEALRPGPPADLARAAALDEALRELRATCAATRGLLPDPAADPYGDGTLDVLAALAEDGWFVLAERMTEELGALLAPRARFRRALAQAPQGAEAALAELRRQRADAPGGDPWAAATRLLWRTRMEGLCHIGRDRERPDPRGGGIDDDDDLIFNEGAADEQPDL